MAEIKLRNLLSSVGGRRLFVKNFGLLTFIVEIQRAMDKQGVTIPALAKQMKLRQKKLRDILSLRTACDTKLLVDFATALKVAIVVHMGDRQVPVDPHGILNKQPKEQKHGDRNR